MTAKEALERVISSFDEKQAAECLARIRPRPSELRKMVKSERVRWLALFPMESDPEEFADWEAASLADLVLIDE